MQFVYATIVSVTLKKKLKTFVRRKLNKLFITHLANINMNSD